MKLSDPGFPRILQMKRIRPQFLILAILLLPEESAAFSPSACRTLTNMNRKPDSTSSLFLSIDQGQETLAASGSLQGCFLTPLGDDELPTEWKVRVEEEADLGRFSASIYKTIIEDAKRQRFQGFRPGTIPPHIEPTYRALCMDEVAREVVLEALQQHQVTPFSGAREAMKIEEVRFLPPEKRRKKSNKKRNNTKKGKKPRVSTRLQWRTYPKNLHKVVEKRTRRRTKWSRYGYAAETWTRPSSLDGSQARTFVFLPPMCGDNDQSYRKAHPMLDLSV